MYKLISEVVYISLLLFHLFFVHVALAFTTTPDTSLWWAIPFALTYALFMGLTMGICYHYVLPKKSQKYWENKTPDNPDGCSF